VSTTETDRNTDAGLAGGSQPGPVTRNDLETSEIIEGFLARMPTNIGRRWEPQEKQKWEAWVSGFLPLYDSGDKEQRKRVHTYIRSQYIIQQHVPIMEMMWEFGQNTAYADVLPEMLHDIVAQDRRWYPTRHHDVLFLLRTSNAIPPEIKVQYFPKEKFSRSKAILKRERRLFRDRLFEQMLQQGKLPQDSSVMVSLLRSLHKGNILPPEEDPEFTNKILKLPYEKKHIRKIKKYLKKIHKRFPQWAAEQTEKLVKK